jgi:hypothetical protein
MKIHAGGLSVSSGLTEAAEGLQVEGGVSASGGILAKGGMLLVGEDSGKVAVLRLEAGSLKEGEEEVSLLEAVVEDDTVLQVMKSGKTVLHRGGLQVGAGGVVIEAGGQEIKSGGLVVDGGKNGNSLYGVHM